jgi:hypothetical protein
VTRHPAPFVDLSREVEEALVKQGPVVALETTLVAHGFPHPVGIETALAAEQAVREAGAVPATIGLVDGAVRVGLTVDELERMASTAPRRSVPATWQPCWPTARWAPRRSRARWPSRRCAGSATSRRAGSAACTVTPTGRSTSRPT